MSMFTMKMKLGMFFLSYRQLVNKKTLQIGDDILYSLDGERYRVTNIDWTHKMLEIQTPKSKKTKTVIWTYLDKVKLFGNLNSFKNNF